EDNSKNISPIPLKSKPVTCLTKVLFSSAKITHFVPAPKTSATAQYLCSNYHTNFTSATNKEYNIFLSNFTTYAANPTNKKTKIFLQNLAEISKNISSSSTLTHCQYTCSKC